MKRNKAHYAIAIGLFMLTLLATAGPLTGQIQPAARYEGNWRVAPNGDVDISRQFKLPLSLYRKWKDADVHMLEFRNFEAGRSNIEVTNKKAEWDDVNRTLTLKMTALGLARNMGTNWETNIVPGLEFSNLDEGKKFAFFHFALDGPMGRVQGQDIIHLPPQSFNLAWNEPTRTITYCMPAPKPATVAQADQTSHDGWWLLGAAVFAAAAVGLWGVSFFTKSKGAPTTEQQ